jgi:hypothetical protein
MKIEFELSPKRLTSFFSIVVAALWVFSFVATLAPIVMGTQNESITKIVHFFSVDSERSIATWYSSFALVVCAVLVAAIAQHKANLSDPYKWHWRGLAALFFLLSLDEALALHEETIEPLRQIFGSENFMFYPWVIPAMFVVGLVGLLYLRFLFHLPRKYQKLFVGAALMFAVGALGFELIGGFIAANATANPPYIYVICYHIEELLEMSSVVVFIYTLTAYMREYTEPLHVHIGHVESHQRTIASAKLP